MLRVEGTEDSIKGMVIFGTAEFAHSDGSLSGSMEITPTTEYQHDQLEKLAASGKLQPTLYFSDGKLTVKFELKEDPGSLDKLLAEADIDPAGETSAT